MSNAYDVIVIGSGAGGGTLVHTLAPSGKRILLLERGDYVRRENENWDSRAVNVNGRYQTKEIWKDPDGRDLHPHTNYAVGGNTKFYGAALFRLRKADFGELRHHGGISPAWPVTYEEMEPYYTRAERMYHVHGERGEDPTDPYASEPYPHPAVSHEPRMQHLSEDFASSGLKPFHTPLGIQLEEKSPNRTPCIRCATCDGYPCLVRAKADAQVLAVDPALEFPNVTLLTNAFVERLETTASGRAVNKVVVRRNGDREDYSAEIVVVSAGAIISAALLLRSANGRHPQGLANRSGVVGRHYMGHINSVLMAVSKVPESDHLPEDALGERLLLWQRRLPVPDGAHLVRRQARRRGPELKKLMNQQRACPMHGHECHQGLFARNLYLGERIPLAGVAHQNGTIRFGTDPEASALDRNCKAHDVDNLYVVDASFFPSSGAVNPGLTIMANALRVGDHLRERLA